jgi:myo-inositol-1(or 4)-monophosphatase
MFNVTMALESSGELIAGVIFDPIRNELFTAERGGGSYLNNRRIRVSQTRKLHDALVSTGFPSRRRHLNINIHFYHQLGMQTHGVRRCGSAAIDLAYVACGRMEAFWEFGLNPWDMAAGLLLIEEAGGKYSGMHGEPHRLQGPDVVADNGLIHDEIVGLFEEIFSGQYRVPMPAIAG